jgi:hypothetical protein
VRRVRDRERKWLKRHCKTAATARHGDDGPAQRERRQPGRTAATSQAIKATSGRRMTVRGSGTFAETALSSRETPQEVPEHDRETSTGRRPRAPPSA